MKRVEIGLRIAVFAALMMSLVTAALAQAPPAGADKQEMMAKLEKLSSELQLTPAQKTAGRAHPDAGSAEAEGDQS